MPAPGLPDVGALVHGVRGAENDSWSRPSGGAALN
jgi:hypothetical protein